MQVLRKIRVFLNNERGTTAIEYGLIVGIVMTCLIAIIGTGGALELIYDKMQAIPDAMD